MIKNYRNWISESTDFKHLLTPEQLEWCNSKLKYWSVDEHGFVNVNGSVDISFSPFKAFPVKFGLVNGFFNCYISKSLISLEGAPQQ